MPNTLAISILLLAFFASIVFNGFFRNIAKKNKILIDIPDKSRKFHFNETALTGGLGIFCSILVSGLLLTDFTDAKYSVDLGEKGFLKNSIFNDGLITKNYQVDSKNYNLSIDNKNNESINVIIKDDTTNENITDLPLEIIPISENKFRVILPDGTQKFYLSESGNIYEISPNNEIKSNQFSPVNTDLNNVRINNTSISAFLCMLLILIFMIFDDFIGIKAMYRLLFQSSIVFLMIMMSEEYISNVGNLLNTGDIYLGNFAIPFTIFCVVGLMNAFNMIDGLNGICAAFALVPIIFITLFGNLSYGLLIPIGSILGFLAYNMGFLGKKRRVFLGDSGSNILGFLVAFLCIEFTQNTNNPYLLNPATALWLVAIPLVDCINVIISRVIRGLRPFEPGRDHLHHKLLNIGIKPKRIFYIFISFSVTLSLIGFIIEKNFSEQAYISFLAFCIFSLIYLIITKTVLNKNV